MTSPLPEEEYDTGAAEAAGVALTEIIYEDYFGFNVTEKWFFPDKVQFIEYRLLDEGRKVKFQQKTKSAVKINRGTQDASFEMDAAKERTELINTSVVGWRMFRRDPEGGRHPIEVPYSERDFKKWLEGADPTLVQSLEFQIRKSNPWLLGDSDQSIEEYDKEIDRLAQLRDAAKERLQGEDSSSGR